MNGLKFVFFGTPEFAAIVLDKLITADLIPAALVANPDRPIGRKQIITPPPSKILVKIQGLENKIKIFQPENIKSIISKLKSLEPDLFIVAAYSQIIPKEILDIPKLGSIGVHPSLLPKHRGASPIQTAILEGDETTGITLYMVDEKMDHGPILTKEECEIGNANFETLIQKLGAMAGDLLIKTLPKFVNKEIKPEPQNENLATYTRKFETEDGYLDSGSLDEAIGNGGMAAIQIDRRVRALNPDPGVWTMNDGKRMKILETEIIEGGVLKPKKIQMEGGKPTEWN